MRTTLTLDPDFASLLQAETARKRVSFREVVNDAIRRGLTTHQTGSESVYIPTDHHARLLSGFDERCFNRLADELEDESRACKLSE